MHDRWDFAINISTNWIPRVSRLHILQMQSRNFRSKSPRILLRRFHVSPSTPYIFKTSKSFTNKVDLMLLTCLMTRTQKLSTSHWFLTSGFANGCLHHLPIHALSLLLEFLAVFGWDWLVEVISPNPERKPKSSRWGRIGRSWEPNPERWPSHILTRYIAKIYMLTRFM